MRKRRKIVLQLIYISEIVAPHVDAETICATSGRNNKRDEITGILFRNDSHFFQALEGPKEAVENTFIRIINDSRHANLTLLSRKLTSVREFGEWSMSLCKSICEQKLMVEKARAKLGDAPACVTRQFDKAFSPTA